MNHLWGTILPILRHYSYSYYFKILCQGTIVRYYKWRLLMLCHVIVISRWFYHKQSTLQNIFQLWLCVNSNTVKFWPCSADKFKNSGITVTVKILCLLELYNCTEMAAWIHDRSCFDTAHTLSQHKDSFHRNLTSTIWLTILIHQK